VVGGGCALLCGLLRREIRLSLDSAIQAATVGAAVRARLVRRLRRGGTADTLDVVLKLREVCACCAGAGALPPGLGGLCGYGGMDLDWPYEAPGARRLLESQRKSSVGKNVQLPCGLGQCKPVLGALALAAELTFYRASHSHYSQAAALFAGPANARKKRGGRIFWAKMR
jgi:hypothetical protein